MSASSLEDQINNHTESFQYNPIVFPTDSITETRSVKLKPRSELEPDLDLSGQSSLIPSPLADYRTISSSSANDNQNSFRASECFSLVDDEIITSRSKGKEREVNVGTETVPIAIEDGSDGEQAKLEMQEGAIDSNEVLDGQKQSGDNIIELGSPSSPYHKAQSTLDSVGSSVEEDNANMENNCIGQTSKLSLSSDMLSIIPLRNRPKALFTSHSEHATKSTDIRQRQLPPVPRRDSQDPSNTRGSSLRQHRQNLDEDERVSAFDVLTEGPRQLLLHTQAGLSGELPIDLTGNKNAQENSSRANSSTSNYPISWQAMQSPPQRVANTPTQADQHTSDESILSRHHSSRRRSSNTQNISPQSRSRQFSDGSPPVWQADSEVSNCPICSTAFTFFNRRHHCRKCGRVVCALCSPHRIVIPNSYVVYPPLLGEFNSSPDQGSRTRPEFLNNRYSSYQGDVGVEVRICEDCLAGETESSRRRRRRAAENPVGDTSQGSNQHRNPESETQNSVNLLSSPSSDSDSVSRRRSRSNVQIVSGRPPTHSIASYPHHGHSHSLGRTPAHALPPRYLFPNDPTNQNLNSGLQPNSRILNNDHHRAFSLDPSTSGYLMHSHAPSTPSRTSQHSSRHSSSSHPTIRLKETDYCPICYLPLPPVSPETGEREREEHVAACIRRAESYSSPRNTARNIAANATPSPPSAAPHQGTPSETGAASAHGSAPDSADEHIRSQGVGRGGGRMVVYRATEKDTIDFTSGAAEGQKAECVICFEEVEVGDVIARLECLCRYHKKCIREWFDRKGNGECPIHAMNE